MSENRMAEAIFSMKGETVLVTGASSGLGAELARTAARAGATVLAAARREDRLEALAAELSNVIPVKGDITNPGDREVMVRRGDEFGGVSVLVNNAGIYENVVPAEDETHGMIQKTLDVNLVAPLALAQLVAPGMRERGRGSIINIASISGVVGIGRIPQASYAASKAGLVGLTRELAMQWARWGIRVNAIAAGYFKREITAALYENEKLLSWVEQRTPLRRHGEPADFAGAFLLLASQAGRYITGQTLPVDGGWTAQ